MTTIDTDALRVYLVEQCGTAVASGLPAAFLDLADVESLDGRTLCEKAKAMGVDLRQFEVPEDE